MTFGSYIKDRRLALEMSLRQVCLLSGIPLSDWSKMERGVNAAPKNPGNKAAILDTLGAAVSYGMYRTLAFDSWETPVPIVTEIDIDDHLPAFVTLTPEQEAQMRPLIRESLTRNVDF